MEYISENKLQIEEITSRCNDHSSGAIISFVGQTRPVNEKRKVNFLEYEAQLDLAEKSIEKILNEAKKRWNLNVSYACHRIGKVDPGQPAVIVITGADHRDAAYAANRFIIDSIKKDTPIWKKEHYMDGDDNWM